MQGSLQDIARKLGVSVSTVSRALAGKPGVSEARRREIQELAGQSGFRPNPNASSLRTGRGQGLTIVTHIHPTTITGMRNNALFATAQREFHDVRVLVRAGGETLDTAVRRAAANRPRAIVLSTCHGSIEPATRGALRDSGIALATMDTDIPDCDCALIDRVTGMFQATRLLLLTGCERPVFFSHASLDKPDPRMRGIMAAFASLGRSNKDIDIAHVPGSTLKAGYELAAETLRRGPVDGLFCYNDDMAVGALKALSEAGIRVPEDVRLVGFDNLPISEYLPCPLTTVAQPVSDIAESAVQMCRRRLKDPGSKPQRLIFPASLVVRETAPLNTPSDRVEVFRKPDRYVSAVETELAECCPELEAMPGTVELARNAG